MNPIEFKGVNLRVAESQDEYQTLPAKLLSDDEGTLVSCWGLNFWERLQVLFTGRLWVVQASFFKPITPQFFTVFINEVPTE
jgi:hypothetical protein